MAARLAFFDIDGTLLEGDCGVLFARFCARRGFLDLRDIGAMAAWIARTAVGLIDEAAVAEAKQAALRFQLRVGEAQAAELLDECFTTEILPRRRVAILEELARCRDEGDVVLVTANLRDFAIRWGVHLGLPASSCFGAEGKRVDGQLTDSLAGPVPMGDERARLVAKQIADRRADARQTSAFGDSMFDLPMLRVVASPCAVYPARALRKIARREGWRIVG